MFKISVLSFAVLVSASAHSAITLYGYSNNDGCIISNDLVTKTVRIDQGKLSFTTTQKISTEGLETYAQKALTLAREERQSNLGMRNFVEIDGVKAPLQFEDSSEARALIQFLRKACQYI